MIKTTHCWIYESELKRIAQLQKIELEKFLEKHLDVYALWENCPFSQPDDRVYKVMYENFLKV